MKTGLFEKHSLLDHFYREAKTICINIDDNIAYNRQVVKNQIQRWKNKDVHNQLLDSLEKLDTAKQEFETAKKNLVNTIHYELHTREVQILQHDYTTYESKLELNESWTDEEAVNLNKFISKEFDDKINSFVQYHSTWKCPSLDANPVDGRYTRAMVGGDPLYVYCEKEAVANLVRDKFNEFYAKRRLRIYNHLDKFPQNQIGLAVCINLFEYLPLDPIKDITKKIFNILRPGGIFLLSYNNCEERRSLELLSNSFRCYGTRSLIANMLYSQGYDVTDSGSTDDGAWNWMIVQKPGILETQKLSSTSVKIIPKKPKPEDVPMDIMDWVLSHRNNIAPRLWVRNLQQDWANCPGKIDAWEKHSGTITWLINANKI